MVTPLKIEAQVEIWLGTEPELVYKD